MKSKKSTVRLSKVKKHERTHWTKHFSRRNAPVNLEHVSFLFIPFPVSSVISKKNKTNKTTPKNATSPRPGFSYPILHNFAFKTYFHPFSFQVSHFLFPPFIIHRSVFSLRFSLLPFPPPLFLIVTPHSHRTMHASPNLQT